jgi:hypothetical protein
MPEFNKEQSERTLSVAKAMQRKLGKSIKAHPLNQPSPIESENSPVMFLIVNNHDGHTYKVVITEYS